MRVRCFSCAALFMATIVQEGRPSPQQQNKRSTHRNCFHHHPSGTIPNIFQSPLSPPNTQDCHSLAIFSLQLQFYQYLRSMGKPWFTELQLALITVYVIVAVDVFGLTLIVPVLVTYARYLGATEAAVGYLYAVYSGMALLSSLFVGRLSDRYGRRAVFLYCCVGAIASFAGSVFSTTFVQFAICRGISGLFTGTMGNAYAYIGDLVEEKDKARYISYVTATLSTCFVVGPIIGGGFAAIDIRAPFVAAAVMAVIELFLVYFFVHDPQTINTAHTNTAHTNTNNTNNINNNTTEGDTTHTPLLADEERPSTLTPGTTRTGESPYQYQHDIHVHNEYESSDFMSLSDPGVPPLPSTVDEAVHELGSVPGTPSSVASTRKSMMRISFADNTNISNTMHYHPVHNSTTNTTNTMNTANTTLNNTNTANTTNNTINDTNHTTRTSLTYHPTNTRTTSQLSEAPSETVSDTHTIQTVYPEPNSISPWLHPSALLIGGVGTFLSTTTYCGMAILVPFMLMDPGFGIVSSSDDTSSGMYGGSSTGSMSSIGNIGSTGSIGSTVINSVGSSIVGVVSSNINNDDDISSHDSKKLSLIIGYLLTILGVIQVIGMLVVFPRVNKRLGLMVTGAIGACIYGVSFCMLVFVHKLLYLYPIVVGLAVGYSLCRPVYPAYLSIVAHKDRRAVYQTMSTCFIQVAWIFSIVLTQFWSYSPTGAILYCGGASVLNAVMMLVYGVYTRNKSTAYRAV